MRSVSVRDICTLYLSCLAAFGTAGALLADEPGAAVSNAAASTSPSGADVEMKNKAGLHVDLSINRPPGGRYRRPYVAVWLEDQDGFPVKTAALWLQADQPGPRWHRDLTRWYRNDRMRKLVEDTDVIDAVSGPTRGPGDYSAYFDGTDNNGKLLPSGRYTLCIEVAREHGTYQLIKDTLELGDKPIRQKGLKGNLEVSAASYRFTPFAIVTPKEETAAGDAASVQKQTVSESNRGGN